MDIIFASGHLKDASVRVNWSVCVWFFVDVIVCMLVVKMLKLNPSNPISRGFVQKAILTMDEVNCNFCFFFLPNV